MMKKLFFLIFLIQAVSPLKAVVLNFNEISDKGDRNLKVILHMYDKYPFMPAKKAFYNDLEKRWIREKANYVNSPSKDRKQALDQLFVTYKLTNDVLKDICIDMANLSDSIMDDFTDKLVDIESKKIKVKNEKYYNRFLVSQRQFSRAERGFKKNLFYYSAGLYDHGIELMMAIYQENNWNFSHMPQLVSIVKPPQKSNGSSEKGSQSNQ